MIELKLKITYNIVIDQAHIDPKLHVLPESSFTPCKIVNYSELLVSDKNGVIMALKMPLKTSNS
jgi:hypothetical protein